MGGFEHTTVLLRETVDAVGPRAGGIYADATAGGGGHSEALLRASEPDGRVVAVDRDPAALRHCTERLSEFGQRVRLVHGEFADLPRILQEAGSPQVDGVIADLGVSSPQLDEAGRGFSFREAGPLDMRMDTSQGETAAELIARLSDTELADIIFQYGEERRSRPIARSILRAQEAGHLETTEDLRRAVIRVTGPRRKGIDPATRTFQGLRIAVNGELSQLRSLLDVAPELLMPGGVVAIISFHSLEDRIVKHTFRNDPRLEVLTKRPLIAGEQEQGENPRARSAKLRVARRLSAEEMAAGGGDGRRRRNRYGGEQ